MATPHDITTFHEPPAPAGATPWVVEPSVGVVEVVAPDPAWPARYERLATRLREALGPRVLGLQHVGSTAVPGLWAKPVIDVDLVVADPSREDLWLPPLESAGLLLVVREPWWQGHRCLRSSDPVGNVHVFGPEAAEPWKHRILRDHLRRDGDDRELYAQAKRAAADATSEQSVMQYNARKETVVREIYARAFAAAGLA